MSLDGTFLHCVVSEMLSAGLVGGRIDKIYQPSREEIIISIRSAGKHNKILISSNSMSARVCMTERAAENPSAPPMFCMLLRKHLSGGKLLDITQDGLERIINFDFECMNEIGDMVVNRLTAEIMGRHSNIILMAKKDGVYRVTDSIKRITDDVSSVRRILPNIVYETPPRDLTRVNFLICSDSEFISAVKQGDGKRLSKHLTACLEGISPVFARECAYYSCRDTDFAVDDMTDDNYDRLLFFIKRAREYVTDKNGFTILRDLNGTYKDFCFMPIEQYGTQMLVSHADGANALLDIFYGSKPPGCGTLEECEQRVRKYKLGILVQTVGELEDSLDGEGMMRTEAMHKASFYSLEKDLRKFYPNMLPIGAGCCIKCKTCTCPDAPCRFPDQAFSSMEAYGMLVMQVCQANHLDYYYGPGKIAYTSCYLLK